VQETKQTKFASMKVTTPKFRASFPAVFEPRPDLNGDMKYSVDMLFSKESTDFKKLKQAVSHCIKETWGTKPERFKSPFKEGATKTRAGKVLDGYQDTMVITAKTKDRPQIVDKQMNKIIDRNDFYGGCYAHASVVFKAYAKGANVGVTCYLQNIQKLEDGPSFGGRSNAEDDFEVIGGVDFDIENQQSPEVEADDFGF